jgi:hypothetical protein
MPGRLFWILLPIHILMNLSASFKFFLRGQVKVIFKAKWDAIIYYQMNIKRKPN